MIALTNTPRRPTPRPITLESGPQLEWRETAPVPEHVRMPGITSNGKYNTHTKKKKKKKMEKVTPSVVSTDLFAMLSFPYVFKASFYPACDPERHSQDSIEG